MAKSEARTVSPHSRQKFAAQDAQELARLLRHFTDADTVELKVTVPETDRRPVLIALGADPLDAHVRQVVFADTPDLRLHSAGVTIRARRTHHRPADVVVTVRPADPETLSDYILRLPELDVEVDASPTGFLCSCSIKHERPDDRVRELMGGRDDVMELLDQAQRSLLEHSAGREVRPENLRVFGPIHVLTRKFVPKGYPRRLIVEMWFLPDGHRMLELSTRCEPSTAYEVAAQTRAFLAAHGVDLDATEDVRTTTALTTLAAQM